jgi:type II secretory pathway pseudopilin PulG
MSAGKKVWIPRVVKPKKQKGFTLLAVLLMVAATGAGLAAIGELVSHALQREKETELLFVGSQYREAIASYYRPQKTYPAKLEDLLEDQRFPVPRRHLRKLYRDPITGQRFATVAAPQGGIMGVHSPSEAEPVKSANFLVRDEAFTDAGKYSEWKFVYATATASSNATTSK